MELANYKKKATELFNRLLDSLDQYEDSIDYDFGSAKLVLRFDEKPSVVYVINTQQAAMQIWVAGEAQAWHFDWMDEKMYWYDSKNSVELFSLLDQKFSQLTNQRIHL